MRLCTPLCKKKYKCLAILIAKLGDMVVFRVGVITRGNLTMVIIRMVGYKKLEYIRIEVHFLFLTTLAFIFLWIFTYMNIYKIIQWIGKLRLLLIKSKYILWNGTLSQCIMHFRWKSLFNPCMPFSLNATRVGFVCQ